jgi:uncharacterized protein (DUF1330 family)
MEEFFVDPSRANFDAFKALARDTPINMLNLIRYRDRAQYPAGHSHEGCGLSGLEAYAEYGRTSEPIFSRVGGKTIWRGKFEAMVTGPSGVGEQWDLGFIAFYPNAAAFLAMITDSAYKIAVVHRQAAVLTSRLVRFHPLEVGKGFA